MYYFIECPLYIDLRLDLFSTISIFTDASIETILYGNPELSLEQNKVVFDAVHLYMLKTMRFK